MTYKCGDTVKLMDLLVQPNKFSLVVSFEGIEYSVDKSDILKAAKKLDYDLGGTLWTCIRSPKSALTFLFSYSNGDPAKYFKLDDKTYKARLVDTFSTATVEGDNVIRLNLRQVSCKNTNLRQVCGYTTKRCIVSFDLYPSGETAVWYRQSKADMRSDMKLFYVQRTRSYAGGA